MIVVVDVDHDGARVDRVVKDAAAVGMAVARRLCDAGAVRSVEGSVGRVLAAGDRVVVGQVIDVDVSGVGADAYFGGRAVAAIDVLAVVDDVVVVDKARGLPTHPLSPKDVDSAAQRAVAAFAELSAGVSDDVREAGALHRLDTGTSGCLAFARSRAAWLTLRARFDEAHKRYLAIVAGAVDHVVVVDSAVGHDARDRRRMIAGAPDGKAATTTITPMAQSPSGAHSLVRLDLEGGRRHQLRVHLASVGHAIVGDDLYGGEASDDGAFFLHAWQLGVPGHPTVTAPIPAHFIAALGVRGLVLSP